MKSFMKAVTEVDTVPGVNLPNLNQNVVHKLRGAFTILTILVLYLDCLDLLLNNGIAVTSKVNKAINSSIIYHLNEN